MCLHAGLGQRHRQSGLSRAGELFLGHILPAVHMHMYSRDSTAWSKFVIVYEAVWPISTGKVASPQQLGLSWVFAAWACMCASLSDGI